MTRSHCEETTLHKAGKLVNKVARAICNEHDRINIRGSDLAKQLGMSQTNERRYYLMATLTHKLLNNIGPMYMIDKLTTIDELNNRSTSRD